MVFDNPNEYMIVPTSVTVRPLKGNSSSAHQPASKLEIPKKKQKLRNFASMQRPSQLSEEFDYSDQSAAYYSLQKINVDARGVDQKGMNGGRSRLNVAERKHNYTSIRDILKKSRQEMDTLDNKHSSSQLKPTVTVGKLSVGNKTE